MADAAHLATDKRLKELEKQIAKEYKQAAEEAQAKLDDYFRRYKVKDEIWQKRVAAGKVTEAEYHKWQIGQIMVGQRWEELKETLADDYHNANVIARTYIDGAMPGVYALNNGYSTYLIEKTTGVDTSFTLYNREAVERLIRDEPEVLPPPGKEMRKKLAEGRDIAWQKGQIQSVTLQSILQGESLPNASKRIAETLGETNHKSTIRYARTAITGAQNAGRQDAYRRAVKLGIDMQREWVATLDGRTRHEHRILDGQLRDVDEPFEVDGYEIMFPGDPTAEGFLIWNCRCTTVARIKGWDDISGKERSTEGMDGMTYEEWLDAKPISHSITKQEEIAETMRRKYIRELYGGYSSNKKPPVTPPKQTTAPPKKKATKKPKKAEDKFLDGISGVPDDFKRGMEGVLNATANKEVKAIYAKYASELRCVEPNLKKGAFFRNSDNGVHMNLKNVAAGNSYEFPYETAFHEFGHQIDYLAGGKNALKYLSNQGIDGTSVRLGDIMKNDFLEHLS